MTELTFERRDGHCLVLLDEDGNEFNLPVDEALLSEVRTVVRQQKGGGKVRPAEVQQLLRRGHSISEVAALTGFDEGDIERFEAPVAAELEYILQRAQQVPVRTRAKQQETDEQFGAVITERLLTLAAENTRWRSWKDEKGWHIAVEFNSYGTEHRAVWSFNSAKMQLNPETADAVNLSKQGQVGDGLIPKPRPLATHPAGSGLGVQQDAAADAPSATEAAPGTQTHNDNTDTPAAASGVNQTAQAADTEGQGADTTETNVTEFPDFGGGSAAGPDRDPFDFAAGASHEPQDLGETANLLEALRQRRSEREQQAQSANVTGFSSLLEPPLWDTAAEQDFTAEVTEEVWEPAAFGNALNGSATSPAAPPQDAATPGSPAADPSASTAPGSAATTSAATTPAGKAQPGTAAGAAAPKQKQGSKQKSAEGGKKRGRAAMPSWDDILFGTRSEEDPS